MFGHQKQIYTAGKNGRHLCAAYMQLCMGAFSHLDPCNILHVSEGEEEMEAGAGFLHVVDTVSRFFDSFRKTFCLLCFIHEKISRSFPCYHLF